MKKTLALLLITLATMSVSGCLGGGGGGSSSSGGAVFSDVSSSVSDTTQFVSSEQDYTPEVSNDIAKTTHNPEPATLVLFGSGLIGMVFTKRKKETKKMKKIVLAVLLVIGLCLITAPSAMANTFVNGGFEDGNLGSWTGGGGSWFGGGAPVNPSVYAGGTPNNSIIGIGVDPLVGGSTVYNGNWSARANDSYNNYSVSTLTQSVTNYTDTNIYFAWKAVLESSHGLYDSDYFSLTLRDDSTNTDLVSRGYSSAGAIGGGTSGVVWSDPLSSGWYTGGWIVENIDLNALGVVGNNFTLTLLASDCPYGGHAGYVYLDGFGVAPPVQGNGVIPEPATMSLLGFGLLGLAGLRRKKA